MSLWQAVRSLLPNESVRCDSGSVPDFARTRCWVLPKHAQLNAITRLMNYQNHNKCITQKGHNMAGQLIKHCSPQRPSTGFQALGALPSPRVVPCCNIRLLFCDADRKTRRVERSPNASSLPGYVVERRGYIWKLQVLALPPSG